MQHNFSKQINKIKNVDIQIKKNDALTVLASSVKLSIKETEQRIISFLKKHNEFISTEACGYSINELSEIEEFELKDLMNTCFVMNENNTEVKELLEAIIVVGFGDCPDCGCELETESESEGNISWTNSSCVNCEYADTGEPDWDSMPGGHDDY